MAETACQPPRALQLDAIHESNRSVRLLDFGARRTPGRAASKVLSRPTTSGVEDLAHVPCAYRPACLRSSVHGSFKHTDHQRPRQIPCLIRHYLLCRKLLLS